MTEETPAANRPVWLCETTHPDLSKEIQEKLREIVDPEIGMNMIQLGLVRNIEITDKITRVTMILTTPFCPYGPSLIENVRAKTEEVVNLPTTIQLGDEMWDYSMMEEGSEPEWGLW
jgi:metal-sulfur cluster biosynthetic enzyme